MAWVRRSIAVLVVVLATHGPSAQAQWGWGGWGGGVGTPGSSIATGMGVYAAGAGKYNVDTAVANNINSQTVMQWNQYMYQSQLEANQRYHQRLADNQKTVSRTRDEVYKRLHDNPTPNDIVRGDALNVVLDEVSNPKVYLKGLQGAQAKLKGTAIREIPFQYAAAAITTSMDQLTKGGPPPALKTEAFAADRAELKRLAAELRKQSEDDGKMKPETLEQVRNVLRSARAKVEATIPKNTPDRTAAEKYLKGLFGLTRLLETPALDVLLSGVDKRPEVTLGDLLSFMKVFNFRFGVASTPAQKMVYNDLYPMLVNLRNEIVKAGIDSTANVAAVNPDHPGELFSKIGYENLDTKVPPPPAPDSK